MALPNPNGNFITRSRQWTAGQLSGMQNPLLRMSGWLLNAPDRIASRRALRDDYEMSAPQMSSSPERMDSSAVVDILNTHTEVLTSIRDILTGQRRDDAERFQEESERAERLSEAQSQEESTQDVSEERIEKKGKSSGIFGLITGLAGVLFSALTGGVKKLFTSLTDIATSILRLGFDSVFSALKIGASTAMSGVKSILSAGVNGLSNLLSSFTAGTMAPGLAAAGTFAGGAALGAGYALGALKLIGGDAYATKAEFDEAKKRGVVTANKGAIELSARNKLFDYLNNELGMPKELAQKLANDLQSVNRDTNPEGNAVIKADVNAEYVAQKVQEWRDSEKARQEKAKAETEARKAAWQQRKAAESAAPAVSETPIPSMNDSITVSAESKTQPARVSSPGTKRSANFTGKQQQAIDFFQSQGWKLHEAQAIAANLSAESSMNERAEGDKNTNFPAYGIAQWRKERRSKFQDVIGKPIETSSFEDQLAYVDWELRNTEKLAGQKLSQTKTYEEATDVVAQYYERPYSYSAKATSGERIKESTRRIGQLALASPVTSVASNRNAVPVARQSASNAIQQNVMVPIQVNNVGGASQPIPIPVPIVTRTTSLSSYLAVNAI
jgi:hypothetical protein